MHPTGLQYRCADNSASFTNVGCVLRTISISANSHVTDSSQPVSLTNLVNMVHGMHPAGLNSSTVPEMNVLSVIDHDYGILGTEFIGLGHGIFRVDCPCTVNQEFVFVSTGFKC